MTPHLTDSLSSILAERGLFSERLPFRSTWSFASIESTLSSFSMLSIGSTGSILSIGSTGSILSIGSAGSILSIGSAGSILSFGSAGSILSSRSTGKILCVGDEKVPADVLARRQRQARVTAGLVGLAAVVALARRAALTTG